MKNTTRKTVKTLPCELTEAEYVNRAAKMASLHCEISEAHAELKAVVKPIRERIKELQGTLEEVAEVVHSRIERRDVTCAVVKDFEAGTETTVRLDTDEVVHVRRLSESEMQTDLVEDDGHDPEA